MYVLKLNDLAVDGTLNTTNQLKQVISVFTFIVITP